MQVKTKFETGQDVFIVYDNTLKTGFIHRINISISAGDIYIQYMIRIPYEEDPIGRDENLVFRTPKEATQHLLAEFNKTLDKC